MQVIDGCSKHAFLIPLLALLAQGVVYAAHVHERVYRHLPRRVCTDMCVCIYIYMCVCPEHVCCSVVCRHVGATLHMSYAICHLPHATKLSCRMPHMSCATLHATCPATCLMVLRPQVPCCRVRRHEAHQPRKADLNIKEFQLRGASNFAVPAPSGRC